TRRPPRCSRGCRPWDRSRAPPAAPVGRPARATPPRPSAAGIPAPACPPSQSSPHRCGFDEVPERLLGGPQWHVAELLLEPPVAQYRTVAQEVDLFGPVAAHSDGAPD